VGGDGTARGTAPLTLGTAGHIDHGKTALIRELTGVDTDRLPEERERGISIDLGFAALVLPSGRRLSVVDVPGHERFVRTMVAGATGIDLFLMTIAADDGVMPQTVEHLKMLRSLGVERGVVAITKADLADPARATAEAGELLPGVRAVATSTRTLPWMEWRLRCGGPSRRYLDTVIREAPTVRAMSATHAPVACNARACSYFSRRRATPASVAASCRARASGGFGWRRLP